MPEAPSACNPDSDEAKHSSEQSPGLFGPLVAWVLDEFNSQDGDAPRPAAEERRIHGALPVAEDNLQSPLLKANNEERLGLVMREAFNAVTIMFPTLAASAVLHMEQTSGTYSCLTCGYVILAGMGVSMVFSVFYHLVCAVSVYRPGFDARCWRCLDQTFIWIGGNAISYGLSHSMVYTFGIFLPLSVYSVVRLWVPSQTELRHHRFQRMGVGIIAYLAPMFTRGDYWRLCGCLACVVVFTALFALDHVLAGWGHGLMHLGLVPFAYLLMSSAMQVRD